MRLVTTKTATWFCLSWDTHAGKAAATREANGVNQAVTCDLPEIATEIAIKVVATNRGKTQGTRQRGGAAVQVA